MSFDPCGKRPSAVVVGGRFLEIEDGWRFHTALESLDLSDPSQALLALEGGYADGLSGYVAEHAPDALQALLEWHVEAYSCMEYGTEPKRAAKAKRLFDMEQDMAIIYCDFMRLYRIDLSEWEGTWQRFVALLMGAMRTEGSLLSTAIMARSPIPANAKGQERKQLLARQEAWSLPLTEDELVERMKKIF